MLEALQQRLEDKTLEADELVTETKTMAALTREVTDLELAEKDKQLDDVRCPAIPPSGTLLMLMGGVPQMRALLDKFAADAIAGSHVRDAEAGAADAQRPANGETASLPPDVMDEYLISILKEKDAFQDIVHDLRTELVATKVCTKIIYWGCSAWRHAFSLPPTRDAGQGWKPRV